MSLEAVEKSSVVLLGMTQKFKDSPSCRCGKQITVLADPTVWEGEGEREIM